jgi:hypothetical protein
MSRRRTQIGGQFAPRLIEMLESPAYRVLSLSGRRVLDRVEIELAHHGGTDNGRLPVTYDDFVKYGMHRHAIAPAIREAVALGFVEITEHGRAGNAEHRTPNLFRLTYRSAKGLPGNGTHEWRKIGDMNTAEEIAEMARRQASPKNISQWRKTPSFGAGNHHQKRKSPVSETATTGHGTETATTIDISGRGRACNEGDTPPCMRRSPSREARPPAPSGADKPNQNNCPKGEGLARAEPSRGKPRAAARGKAEET